MVGHRWLLGSGQLDFAIYRQTAPGDGFAGFAPPFGRSTGSNGRVATGVTPGRTGRRANLLTGRGAHQVAAADTAPSQPVGPGRRAPAG